MILLCFRGNDLKNQLLEIRTNKKFWPWKSARRTENSEKTEKKSKLTQLFIPMLRGRTKKITENFDFFLKIVKIMIFKIRYFLYPQNKKSQESFSASFVPLSLLWPIYGENHRFICPTSHFEKIILFENSEFLLIISKYFVIDFQNWNIWVWDKQKNLAVEKSKKNEKHEKKVGKIMWAWCYWQKFAGHRKSSPPAGENMWFGAKLLS